MTPDEPDREEDLAPAEAAVLALLELLRADAPQPDDSTTDIVMRTARWQYAVRGTLALIGEMVGTLAEGVALVLGVRAESTSREQGR